MQTMPSSADKPKNVEAKEVPQYRKVSSSLNVVRQDGIQTELVKLQEASQRTWETRWGFMKNYDKLLEEEARGIGLDPEILRRRKTAGVPSKDFYKWALPPSPPVPVTSSGFIGWRSSLDKCTLEKVGPLYISPVSTIEPPLVSGETKPVGPQNVIFIG